MNLYGTLSDCHEVKENCIGGKCNKTNDRAMLINDHFFRINKALLNVEDFGKLKFTNIIMYKCSSRDTVKKRIVFNTNTIHGVFV